MAHMIDCIDDLPAFERNRRVRAEPARIDRSKPKSKRPWRGHRANRPC